jgi:hypothetical protein
MVALQSAYVVELEAKYVYTNDKLTVFNEINELAPKRDKRAFTGKLRY